MTIMFIILTIIGIFTFINFNDIKKLKKENQELRLQNRIAMETIEFLKRKINPDYKPYSRYKRIDKRTNLYRTCMASKTSKRKKEFRECFRKEYSWCNSGFFNIYWHNCVWSINL